MLPFIPAAVTLALLRLSCRAAARAARCGGVAGVTSGAIRLREVVEPRPLTLSRVTWLASIVFFGVLPALTRRAARGRRFETNVAIDFRQFYGAAEAILRGESPYPPNGEPTTSWGGPYPYPPLPALLDDPADASPGRRPRELSSWPCSSVVALAVLFVVGVRDWRCYGVAAHVAAGHLGRPDGQPHALARAGVLLWRGGSATALVPSSASIGITLAAKFFLWPLVVWLAATRRVAGAALDVRVGAGAAARCRGP